MNGFTGFLADNQLWLFVAFAVLLLVIIIVMAVLLVSSRRKAARAIQQPLMVADAPRPAEQPFRTRREMWRSFRTGLRTFRDRVAGSRNLYLVPWYVAVGGPGSGKTSLLASLPINHPPAEATDLSGKSGTCGWWFYDRAVVLDVGGDAILRRPGVAIVPDGPWQTLLGLLRWHRDRRPLDGIILTISVEQLMGAQPAEIGEWSMYLYGKLWEAQKQLGLCLPTYVVITKCDLLPGFQPFVDQLPAPLHDSILGWSNPYPVEAAFRPEWLDDAFSELMPALFQAQVELFAENPEPTEGDSVLFFPTHFQQLKEPLRQALGIVFRRTAFQEGLFMRGIYFTGANIRERGGLPILFAPPNDDDTALPVAPLAQPVFARDLFANKVFAEQGLVRNSPQWSALANRSRLGWRLAFGVATVALIALLWVAGIQTQRLSDGFQPALRALPEQMRAADAAASRIGDDRSRKRVLEDIIRTYTRTDDDWRDPPIPAPWFSTLENRVDVALAIGYHKTFAALTRSQLDRIGRRLGSPDLPLSPDAVRVAGPIELQRLRDFLGQAVMFERFATVFNATLGSGDLDGLPELVRYAHDIELPPDFMNRAASLGFTAAPANRALRGAVLDNELQPIDLSVYREETGRRLEQLAVAYLARLSSRGDVLAKLRQAASDINRLGSSGQSPQPVNSATLQSILGNLNSAADDFGAQANGGLFSLGSQSDALLGLIADSALFGPEVRDRLVQRARSMMGVPVDDPGRADSLIGPLIDSTSGRLTLSPNADALRGSLNRLLAHPFMRAGGDMPVLLGGTGTAWDTVQLDGTMGLVEDYLLSESELDKFPQALRNGVRAASRQRLSASLLSGVGKAQVPANTDNSRSRTDELRGQIRSFSNAAPVLVQILQAARQHKLDAYTPLYNAITGQATALLNGLSGALLAERVYQVQERDLQSWTDGPVPVAQLFGQSSLDAVPAYLAGARARVAAIARDGAEPLLNFLGRSEIGVPATRAPSAGLWIRTLAELDRAETGRIGGSISALDKFIMTTLPDIDPSKCGTLRRSGGDDNYFGIALAELEARVQQRCLIIAESGIAESYLAITTAFNTYLAGRYPFSQTNDPQAQVRPEELAAFAQVFDPKIERLAAQLKRPGFERQRQFVDQMRAVRGFFGPVIGTDDGGYQIEAYFRALPDREAGAEEVIAWQFAAGDQQIDNQQQRKAIRWHYRDPITVAVRWAINSVNVPVADARDGYLVDGRTVRFVEDGPWSLISLLQHYAPNRQDVGNIRNLSLLGFNVPTERRETANDAQHKISVAKLFVELSIRPPPVEGKPPERLTLPTFPREAPDWTTPTVRMLPLNTPSASTSSTP